MLSLAIDVTRLRTALVVGPAATEHASLGRLAQLEAASSSAHADIQIFAPAPGIALAGRAGDRLIRRLPTPADLAGIRLMFIAGLDEAPSASLAAAARAAGALVNVEDRAGLCDFHMPALVRRGSLQIAITIEGRAPGLAGHIRRHLDKLFPGDWAAWLDELAGLRLLWRAEGADRGSIRRRSEAHIDRRGWLSWPRDDVSQASPAGRQATREAYDRRWSHPA